MSKKFGFIHLIYENHNCQNFARFLYVSHKKKLKSEMGHWENFVINFYLKKNLNS